MTYQRVTVVLTEDEMCVLRRLAQRDLRRPSAQASFILREALSNGQSEESPPPREVSTALGLTGTTVRLP